MVEHIHPLQQPLLVRNVRALLQVWVRPALPAPPAAPARWIRRTISADLKAWNAGEDVDRRSSSLEQVNHSRAHFVLGALGSNTRAWVTEPIFMTVGSPFTNGTEHLGSEEKRVVCDGSVVRLYTDRGTLLIWRVCGGGDGTSTSYEQQAADRDILTLRQECVQAYVRMADRLAQLEGAPISTADTTGTGGGPPGPLTEGAGDGDVPVPTRESAHYGDGSPQGAQHVGGSGRTVAEVTIGTEEHPATAARELVAQIIGSAEEVPRRPDQPPVTLSRDVESHTGPWSGRTPPEMDTRSWRPAGVGPLTDSSSAPQGRMCSFVHDAVTMWVGLDPRGVPSLVRDRSEAARWIRYPDGTVLNATTRQPMGGRVNATTAVFLTWQKVDHSTGFLVGRTPKERLGLYARCRDLSVAVNELETDRYGSCEALFQCIDLGAASGNVYDNAASPAPRSPETPGAWKGQRTDEASQRCPERHTTPPSAVLGLEVHQWPIPAVRRAPPRGSSLQDEERPVTPVNAGRKGGARGNKGPGAPGEGSGSVPSFRNTYMSALKFGLDVDRIVAPVDLPTRSTTRTGGASAAAPTAQASTATVASTATARDGTNGDTLGASAPKPRAGPARPSEHAGWMWAVIDGRQQLAWGLGCPSVTAGRLHLPPGERRQLRGERSFGWSDIVLMQQPVRTLLQGGAAERAQDEWRHITEVEQSAMILAEMLHPSVRGSSAAERAEWALCGSDDDLLSIPYLGHPALHARLGELRTVLQGRATLDSVIQRRLTLMKQADNVFVISMYTAERMDAALRQVLGKDYEEGAWNYQSGTWDRADGLWQRGALDTLWQSNQRISTQPGTKVVVPWLWKGHYLALIYTLNLDNTRLQIADGSRGTDRSEVCEAATNMLADRWQYERSVLHVPQRCESLPPVTVTIGSEDGPAQDLNGCAWLLKCVVAAVLAGRPVDRRSVAPDDITWERVQCIMDETEAATTAWRRTFGTMGVQFSSGPRDVRFSNVPGETVQNRRAGSGTHYDGSLIRMRTRDDSTILIWRRNTRDDDRTLLGSGQQLAEQLILSLRQDCVQAHTTAVPVLTFMCGVESAGGGPSRDRDRCYNGRVGSDDTLGGGDIPPPSRSDGGSADGRDVSTAGGGGRPGPDTPQPPPKPPARGASGQLRRRRMGGSADGDTTGWEYQRKTNPKSALRRVAPKGGRHVPSGRRHVSFTTDRTQEPPRRGQSTRNTTTRESGVGSGQPSPFTPPAGDDDDAEMEPPPPETQAPQRQQQSAQQQQESGVDDGEPTVTPGGPQRGGSVPSTSEETARPARKRRRTPARGTGGTDQTPPSAQQQTGPGSPLPSVDRSQPPGMDGMTPGIFDQLPPADRAARSAAFGYFGDQGPQSRDGQADVVRQAPRQKGGGKLEDMCKCQGCRHTMPVTRLPAHAKLCKGVVDATRGWSEVAVERLNASATTPCFSRCQGCFSICRGQGVDNHNCHVRGLVAQSSRSPYVGGKPRGGRKPHSAASHGRAAGGTGNMQPSVFALGPITYAEVDAGPCKAAYAALADFGKRLDPELIHLLPAQYGTLPPGLKTVVEGGMTRMITLLMEDPAGMSDGTAWAWAAFAKLGLCTWLKGELRTAAVRAVMTSWPFNFPAMVLQSAMEYIETRRARASAAGGGTAPPSREESDHHAGSRGRSLRTLTPAGMTRARQHRSDVRGRPGSGSVATGVHRAARPVVLRGSRELNKAAQTSTWQSRVTRLPQSVTRGMPPPHRPHQSGESTMMSRR